MSWKDILKAPYQDTDSRDSSPLVFIDEPMLPKERWDRYYKRRYDSPYYEHESNYTSQTDKETEVSNYGRVKIGGVIQRPKLRGQKVVTEIVGKERTHRSRIGGTGKKNPNPPPMKEKNNLIPYGVTVGLLQTLGYKIPEDAELLNSKFKTYKELTENLSSFGASVNNSAVNISEDKDYYLERVLELNDRKRYHDRTQRTPRKGVKNLVVQELADARRRFKAAGGTQKEIDDAISAKGRRQGRY